MDTPLDDHYKRLVQRLKFSGGQITPKVNSPIISPKQKRAVADFVPLENVAVLSSAARKKNRKKTSHEIANARSYGSTVVKAKKRLRRKTRTKESMRNSSRHNTDESDFDSMTSETDYTSNTDYYDTDHNTDIESSQNRRKTRNKHHGRVNSPLLRRSSTSSHKRDRRRSSRRNEHRRSLERSISVSSVSHEDQLDMGTKSKDELQKLISMAKAQGRDPTDLAVRVLFRDPKIKCLVCCGCILMFFSVVTFLIWKFYF